jgi:hypothetical protein
MSHLQRAHWPDSDSIAGGASRKRPASDVPSIYLSNINRLCITVGAQARTEMPPAGRNCRVAKAARGPARDANAPRASACERPGGVFNVAAPSTMNSEQESYAI